MDIANEPVIVTVKADPYGITVSPTALEVRVGQKVEWRAQGFQAMRLVFYEGNPINEPVLEGVDFAPGYARNVGVYHYQVILARIEAPIGGGGAKIRIFADTGCPTIIIRER